jgi:uncharacterized membrane protein (UPF0127 family)
MKKLIFLMVALPLVAASCNKSSLAQDEVIQIKQHKIVVQLADTPAKRQAGLSGIQNISDSEGMLFLFSTPSQPQFWMKDMNFPIDMIWINGNKIIGITDNVKPQPNTPDDRLILYAPPSVADKVLEVNAGWTFRHDVWAGDTITVLK